MFSVPHSVPFGLKPRSDAALRLIREVAANGPED